MKKPKAKKVVKASTETYEKEYSADPQVHQDALTTETARPDAVVETEVMVTENPVVLEKKDDDAILNEPLKYVVSAPEAIDKAEVLLKKVKEARPDLADQVDRLLDGVEALEDGATGAAVPAPAPAIAEGQPGPQPTPNQAQPGMQAPPQPEAGGFAPGDRVKTQTKDGEFTGVIEDINDDGTLEILTDKNMKLSHVPADSVEKEEEGASGTMALPAGIQSRRRDVRKKLRASEGADAELGKADKELGTAQSLARRAREGKQPQAKETLIDLSKAAAEDAGSHLAEAKDAVKAEKTSPEKGMGAGRTATASKGAVAGSKVKADSDWAVFGAEVERILQEKSGGKATLEKDWVEGDVTVHELYDWFVSGMTAEQAADKMLAGGVAGSKVKADSVLETARREAADAIFRDADLGGTRIEDAEGWEHIEGEDDWVRTVFVKKPGDPEEQDTSSESFVVVFKPGSAAIEHARLGDYDIQAAKAPNKAALMDFLKDHAKSFGCLPGEFEDTDGTVYSQDDYSKQLNDQDHKALSKLMAAKLDPQAEMAVRAARQQFMAGTLDLTLMAAYHPAAQAEVKRLMADKTLKFAASAFDKLESLDLGGGMKARRGEGDDKDQVKTVVVTDADGKQVAKYPDAFGDDTVTIIKLFRQLHDISENDDEKAAKAEDGEGESKKPKAMPRVEEKKEKTDDEKELEAAQRNFEQRVLAVREIVSDRVHKRYVVAQQDDIDTNLLKGMGLEASMNEALKAAVDRELMRLLALPDTELLSIRASLGGLKARPIEVETKVSNEGLQMVAGLQLYAEQSAEDGLDLSGAFGSSFRR